MPDHARPAANAANPSRARRHRTRWLALLLVVWVAGSWLGCLFVVHPITRRVRLPQSLAGLAIKPVRFRSDDGVALAGWWVPADRAAGTVVLCHGAFENRMGVADCVPWLHGAGYHVLVFDFRGRGLSGAGRSTIGRDEARDAAAAVRWVGSRPEAAGLPVGLQGYSMGASAALLAAATCPAVDAVVADSPYASLDLAISRHLRTILGPGHRVLGCLAYRWAPRMLGFDPATVRPIDAITCLGGRPVLLIHGTRDWMTEIEGSRAMSRLCPDAELWEVPRARHTKARRLVPDEYRQRVLAFWAAVFARPR
jgi:alpha-beta hydrolase superfamily lysophospholipase